MLELDFKSAVLSLHYQRIKNNSETLESKTLQEFRMDESVDNFTETQVGAIKGKIQTPNLENRNPNQKDSKQCPKNIKFVKT